MDQGIMNYKTLRKAKMMRHRTSLISATIESSSTQWVGTVRNQCVHFMGENLFPSNLRVYSLINWIIVQYFHSGFMTILFQITKSHINVRSSQLQYQQSVWPYPSLYRFITERTIHKSAGTNTCTNPSRNGICCRLQIDLILFSLNIIRLMWCKCFARVYKRQFSRWCQFVLKK